MSRVADTVEDNGPHSRSPALASARQRTSQLPSLGQPSLRGAAGPNEPSAQGTTVVSRRSSLWSTNELNKLADLVNRHRDASGRIQWRNLGPAWESLRNANDPQRTIAALKGAYAKLARNEGRATNENAARAQGAGAADLREDAERQSGQNDQRDREPVDVTNAGERREPDAGNTPTEQEPRQESGGGSEELMADLGARFLKYYRIAIATQDRQPVRRPKGEIPKVLLQVGNEILAEELRKRKIKSLTSLNAAVYAIARAVSGRAVEDASRRLEPERERFKEAIQLRSTLIRFISVLVGELRRRLGTEGGPGGQGRPSPLYLEVSRLYKVSRTVDVRRLCIRLRDQLNIVQQDIKRMEDAKRRFQVRRRGPPLIAREPRDQGGNVPVDQVREYWAPIVGEVQPFVETEELAAWSRAHRQAGNIHVDIDLTEDDWRTLFSRIKPWKATGPDGIQGFWWKHLPEAKERLKEWCIRALHRRREKIPRWLCRGRVVLIPKGKSAAPGPGDFRPIACLNTCYKVLTAMIANRIAKCTRDRFPKEQVALRKGIWGCTHAHILDQTVCRDAIKHRAELHMLWVDMTKAFDSVSHGAVRWTVRQWGIPNPIIALLQRIMSKQSVRYYGYQDNKSVRSAPLEIRNGLMQGDTLSPLLFCLSIAPISGWLSSNIEPYKTKTGSSSKGEGSLEVGHIFYMDDLKVYTTNWRDLVKAKVGIQRVAEQLGLKMNPQKCAVKSLNVAAEGGTEIGEIPILGLNSFYKYLGAEQDTLVSMREVWQRVQANAWNTAVRIMNSELTVRQKVQGYNQTVIPKLKYAVSCVIFGKGRLDSLKKRARDFDIRVRKLLEESKMRFGYSCVARLYVSKEEGGLGLKSVEEEVEHTIVYTWCYLSSNPDFIVPYQLAESLRASSKRSLTTDFKSVMVANGLEGRVTRTLLTFIEVDGRSYDSATKAARAISTLVHQRWAQFQMSEWKKRRVASRVLEDPDGRFQLNHKDSFLWLSKGWVSSEVLRNVWAVQEGSLLTRASAPGRAVQAPATCRMGCPMRETAEHIVSCCEHWRTNIMVERHDDVARVIYYSLKRKYGLANEVTNTHEPHVLVGSNVEIHWNNPVHTSESLKHNRPDILVWDRNARRIWIIEISVSWYTRIANQERKKISKYGVNSTLPEDTDLSLYRPGPNLKAVLQKDRRCRVDIVPIVLGTCGECSKSLRQNVQNLRLPDKTDFIIEKLSRNAILGTNWLVRSHLARNDE
ncbi:reverse transcriptase [Teladorsagia circumcincta]|uniref:Reverse transcriptase n=1 Tax=Teladorsagia circumcincta TaxID=45464 RepID=A0A2G9TPM4_TELCI|nr:reverse transcriptase [Teladorsagia circumcincta]